MCYVLDAAGPHTLLWQEQEGGRIMAKTVVGLFDTFTGAQNVVQELVNATIVSTGRAMSVDAVLSSLCAGSPAALLVRGIMGTRTTSFHYHERRWPALC
jgi:hypothetical protein